LTSHQNLEVIYSPINTTADDYIIEFLEIKKQPKIWTLITHDRELKRRAKSLGAKTLDINSFLENLFKKGRKPTPEKPTFIGNIDRYLKEFGYTSDE